METVVGRAGTAVGWMGAPPPHALKSRESKIGAESQSTSLRVCMFSSRNSSLPVSDTSRASCTAPRSQAKRHTRRRTVWKSPGYAPETSVTIQASPFIVRQSGAPSRHSLRIAGIQQNPGPSARRILPHNRPVRQKVTIQINALAVEWRISTLRSAARDYKRPA